MKRPFLTARWEDLLLLNFSCPPELLEPLVPRGTELDTWRGTTLLSLVGFMFRDTRVRGVPVPFHRAFEEVNLRFYVRREVGEHVRRGVVFIRELVPRRAVAAVARLVYGEPYLALPMSHRVDVNPATGGHVRYGWAYRGSRFSMGGRAEGRAAPSEPGSGAEFVTEHYWGYTRQQSGDTLEYRVDHPPWDSWIVRETDIAGPFDALYGPDFGKVLHRTPHSSYLATGSAVRVYRGRRLPESPTS